MAGRWIVVCWLVLFGRPLEVAGKAVVSLERQELKLTSAMVAEFTTPGFEQGQYPENIQCSWEIIALAAKKIDVVFEEFDVEFHHDCVWDRVFLDSNPCGTIPGGEVQLCGRLATNYTFTSHTNVICVTFMSDYMIQQRGFKALAIPLFDQTTSPLTTLSPMGSTASSTNVVQRMETQLSSAFSNTQPGSFTFSSPSVSFTSTNQLTNSKIQVPIALMPTPTHISSDIPGTGVNPSQFTILDPLHSTINGNISSLHSSMPSTFSFLPSSDVHPSFTQPQPALMASNPSGSLLPSATATNTSFPPNNQSTSQNILPSLSNTESQKGHSITSSFVAQATQSLTSHRTSQPPTTPEVTELSDATIGNQSSIVLQPRSEFIFVSPRESNGFYPLNQDLSTVFINRGNLPINMSFILFDVEGHPSCIWDYLQITTISAPKKKLCGTHPLYENLYTTDNEISFVFHSDQVIPRRGFKMKVIVGQASRVVDLPGVSTSTETTKNTMFPTILLTVTQSDQAVTSDQLGQLIPSKTTSFIHATSTAMWSASTSVTEDIWPSQSDDILSTLRGDLLVNTALESIQSSFTSISPIQSTSSDSNTFGSKHTPTQNFLASLFLNSNEKSMAPETSTTAHISSTTKLEITEVTASTLPFKLSSSVTSSTLLSESTTPSAPTSTPWLDNQIVEMCKTTEVFMADSVTVLSPGFLDNSPYPFDATCDLSVTAPENREIILTLEYFDVESNYRCDWDFLQLNYGNNRVHMCGQLEPNRNQFSCTSGLPNMIDPITKSPHCIPNSGRSFIFNGRNALRLTFYSDHVIQRTGFNLTLTTHSVETNNNVFTNTVSIPSLHTTLSLHESLMSSTFSSVPYDLTSFTSSVTQLIHNTKDISKVLITPQPTMSQNSQTSTTQRLPNYYSDSTTNLDIQPQTSKIAPSPSSIRQGSAIISHSPSGSSSLLPDSTTKDWTTVNVTNVATEQPNMRDQLPFVTTPPTMNKDDVTSACNNGGVPLLIDGEFGYIESPGFTSGSYPAKTTCMWKIEDGKSKEVQLTFQAFELEPDIGGVCEYDKLTIYETNNKKTSPVRSNTYCGSSLPKSFATKNDVTIVFESDSSQEYAGFKIQYLKADDTNTGSMMSCPAGRLLCPGTDKCIPTEWVCDGETDCPNNGDENHCATCGPGEVRCYKGTCLPGTNWCDGHVDCSHGEDERHCVGKTTGTSMTIQSGVASYPMCYTDDLGSNHGNGICNKLGFRMLDSLWPTPSTGPGVVMASLDALNSMINDVRTTCPSMQITHILCRGEDCGQRAGDIRQKRVIGGSLSASGRWPWTVALRSGAQVICGATIVDEMWLVTAGHCVEYMKKNPQVLSVVAGVSDVNDVKREVRYVVEVILHPDYNFIYNADIALLRVNRPLPMNDQVRKICLPWDGRVFTSSARCYIAGWGVYDMKDYYTTVAPRHLREAKTKVVGLSGCQAVYKHKVKDTMMCAGYIGGGIDACRGDSGGALMCETPSGRWNLAGVISWGEECGNTNKPGVYTRVSAYLGWLNDTLPAHAPGSVNCTFETSDWCGYRDISGDSYFWTRVPGLPGYKGSHMYASRPVYGQPSNLANASLLSPSFTSTSDNCLTFKFLFSVNSNITLSVYGLHDYIDDDDVMNETLLWKVTSNYPPQEAWQTTAAAVPAGTQRLRFESLYKDGGIFGLALDTVIVTPGNCAGLRHLSCTFDDVTSCSYNVAAAWSQFVPRKNSDHNYQQGYVLQLGGNYSHFGYLAKSQLISPDLPMSFASFPHCMIFSFNKVVSSSTELIVASYVNMGGNLANRKVYWSSHNALVGEWSTIKVTVVDSGYFDHVILEVHRSSYTMDDVIFLIDDIAFQDGQCI